MISALHCMPHKYIESSKKYVCYAKKKKCYTFIFCAFMQQLYVFSKYLTYYGILFLFGVA